MVKIKKPVAEFIAEIERQLEQGLAPLPAVQQAISSLGQSYLVQVDEVILVGYPLGSKYASGKFRDKVFVTRKGQETFLRKYRKPQDPKSARQLAQRAKFKQASIEWTELSEAEQETFRRKGAEYGITGINQFIKDYFQSV